MAQQEHSDFGAWITDLLNNPASCGVKGFCLYILGLPTMIICGILGLAVFPPGRYPKLLLIAPGLILGGLVMTILAYIVYKLPSFLAVPLTLAGSAVAYYYAYLIGMQVFS